jgi:hypothetical protein
MKAAAGDGAVRREVDCQRRPRMERGSSDARTRATAQNPGGCAAPKSTRTGIEIAWSVPTTQRAHRRRGSFRPATTNTAITAAKTRRNESSCVQSPWPA